MKFEALPSPGPEDRMLSDENSVRARLGFKPLKNRSVINAMRISRGMLPWEGWNDD